MLGSYYEILTEYSLRNVVVGCGLGLHKHKKNNVVFSSYIALKKESAMTLGLNFGQSGDIRHEKYSGHGLVTVDIGFIFQK